MGKNSEAIVVSQKQAINKVNAKAEKALKLARKNAEKIDTKYFDSVALATAVGTAGFIVNLSNIDQGDNEGNRTGDSVKAKSLECVVHTQGNAVASNSAIRMIVFSDTMNQGTTPAVADVISTAGGFTIQSLPNLLNYDQGRFKFHLDRTFMFNGAGEYQQWLKKRVKYSKRINWLGISGTDEGKNQLYVLFISNNNASQPTVTYQFRLNYQNA